MSAMDTASIIAVDVGGGTQDILLYRSAMRIENCPKLVMPSPTRIVAKRIAEATGAGKPVFLFGETMGGGTSLRAAREHLAAGLAMYATPRAALTFHDDLKRVEQMGVVLADEPPPGAVRIRMGDIDKEALAESLRRFDVELPSQWAVAVQDHGFSPDRSNREARFEWFREFIDSGGEIEKLAFERVPPLFTRMLAVKNLLPDALVMDTGPAAILGALQDETVREHVDEGLLIANAGNYHMMCALVLSGRILALFEHHTGMLDSARLTNLVNRFQEGDLSHEEILNDGGHGCHIGSDYIRPKFLTVTGPQRHIFEGRKIYPAVPHGDMMLTGCFGLIEAARMRGKLTW